jgi:hypothetical protein
MEGSRTPRVRLAQKSRLHIEERTVMTTRRIVVGLLMVIAVASVAMVSHLPPFTPAGTVEIRSLDAEFAEYGTG